MLILSYPDSIAEFDSAYDLMTYATIKPIRLPVNTISLPLKTDLSSQTNNCTIPTASINPGTAYPSERSELIIRLNLLLSRRIKKFIINARIEQSIAEIIPRNSVFEAVIKNFWSKKFRL